MIVFRIAQKEFVEDLSGTGAKLFGGRWNSKGTALLYTSENRSLAMLEIMVHTPQRFIPRDLFIATIYIPDPIFGKTILPEEMPEEWKDYPAPGFLARTGDNFVNENKFLYMKVPSSILKEESNILINPLHAASRQLKLEDVAPFQFDMRLFPKTENPA